MPASKDDVLGYYRDRLRTHQLSLKQLLRRMRLLRYMRAASGLCIPAVIWLAFAVHNFSIAWLAFLPAVMYVAFHWPHERVYERLTRASGAITYYERGIARVEDRWAGMGIVDTTFVGPDHIYANDLDIFGEGSLFELLCTARTRAGQETLARWLGKPASRDEILQRQ